MMKLAHIAIASPRMCGLYETTRELVAAERALGFDARIFDPAPTKYYPKEPEDRGAVLCDKAFVESADVVIDHSGCDGTTDNLETPHILVAHGRPTHSFNSERDGGPPVVMYHARINQTPKYKALVTFWPEHEGYLSFIAPDKPVFSVPPPCDLKAWTNEGPSGYKFHGKAGAYNLVITDAWRDDADMLAPLVAAGLVARKMPGTRTHIYGKPENAKGLKHILGRLQADGALGEVCGWVSGLDNVYRAADGLISPHGIYTRAQREAMACGCPVFGCDAGQIVAKLHVSASRAGIRQQAVEQFDPLKTAKAFMAAVLKVL